MASRTRTRTPAPSPVLDAAAEAARAEVLAGARKFELAAAWAAAHPVPVVEDVVDELGALVLYGDRPVTLAGEGAPGMSEFAIAEFAAACGMSPHQGRAFLGAALECRHRLPRIWARVVAGEVAVWKVRRVTEHTHRLTPTGAAYVDTALAPVLETCSFAQIERAVARAAAEADDEHEELSRAEDWERQHLHVHLDQPQPHTGLIPIEGLLDYPDALALDTALRAGAARLRDAHPELDLDTRRAMAAGRLPTAGTDSANPSREVVVYAHYHPGETHGIVDIEGPRGLAQFGHTTIEQLHDWCTRAGTKVTIRPVLDLDTESTAGNAAGRYRPTEALREQTILTCPTCVFPGCTRSARGCDLDHLTPFHRGGPTTAWNLAPLCRLHHRIKTHGHWTYRRLTRTAFEWTAPDRRTYTVDLTHTRRRTR